MLKPKHSAKHVCRTGTSASSTVSLLTRWYDRTRSTSSQFLTSFLFPTSTSGKVDHTVTDTERKKGIKNITLRISSRRNVRNENSWAFTIGSFVMHDSERPWSNSVALKKWVSKWRSWRTRTTPTLLQKKNSTYIVAIGGYVLILLVPTRCPLGIELIWKQRCLHCVVSRMSKYNTSWYRNSRTNDYDKWLCKSV